MGELLDDLANRGDFSRPMLYVLDGKALHAAVKNHAGHVAIGPANPAPPAVEHQDDTSARVGNQAFDLDRCPRRM